METTGIDVPLPQYEDFRSYLRSYIGGGFGTLEMSAKIRNEESLQDKNIHRFFSKRLITNLVYHKTFQINLFNDPDSDKLPSFVFWMKNLEEVNLFCPEISETLPFPLPAWFSKMNKVKKLKLGGKFKIEEQDFDNCPQIERLDIAIACNCLNISNLHNLKSVNISKPFPDKIIINPQQTALIQCEAEQQIIVKTDH